MLWMKTVIVREGEVGLLYREGRYIRTLVPGRYRLLSLPWLREDLVHVDMRRRPLAIQGQEMLTADAISVRLNVAAEYRVIDAPLALHSVEQYVTALYTVLQLVLREAVQARTLDALLADRAALSAEVMERGRPAAMQLGLELTGAGVRDVILPGDVKRMLAQEVEAHRAGRAALVAAREETAATRAKANTAQLLASNPVLLRLREFEALAQVAGGDGNTVVVAVPAELLSAVRGGQGE